MLFVLMFDVFTFWEKKTPDIILKCSEMNTAIKLSHFSENKHLSQHFNKIHSKRAIR